MAIDAETTDELGYTNNNGIEDIELESQGDTVEQHIQKLQSLIVELPEGDQKEAILDRLQKLQRSLQTPTIMKLLNSLKKLPSLAPDDSMIQEIGELIGFALFIEHIKGKDNTSERVKKPDGEDITIRQKPNIASMAIQKLSLDMRSTTPSHMTSLRQTLNAFNRDNEESKPYSQIFEAEGLRITTTLAPTTIQYSDIRNIALYALNGILNAPGHLIKKVEGKFKALLPRLLNRLDIPVPRSNIKAEEIYTPSLVVENTNQTTYMEQTGAVLLVIVENMETDLQRQERILRVIQTQIAKLTKRKAQGQLKSAIPSMEELYNQGITRGNLLVDCQPVSETKYYMEFRDPSKPAQIVRLLETAITRLPPKAFSFEEISKYLGDFEA